MMSALRPRDRARSWARRAGQRGSVAVEAALVTPIIVTMVLGIIEFSLVMRDYVSVSSAVRVGARIASASPSAGKCLSSCTPSTSPYLTQMAANAIQTAGTAMPKDSIDYIFVYLSNDKGYPGATGSTVMPNTIAGCAALANCVAYRWLDASDRFTYQSGTWDTSTINACPSTSASVGVYMHATHNYITGFFGRTIGMGDRTVMRFEPLDTAHCAAGAHT